MAGITVRPAVLIERDEQWSRLRSLLDEARAEHGRVALVSGPVATGKTRLLRTFAEHAARDGAVFLNATCSPQEQALPFGAVGQLFRTAGLSPERRQRINRLLETGAAASPAGPAAGTSGPSAGTSGPSAGTSGPAPDDHTMAHALHTLCMEMLDLAATAPLIIGVEDPVHADAPSLQWLLYLIRRLCSARVLLVLTETSGPRPAPSALYTELLRHPHCQGITVAPLSEPGVTAVLRSRATGLEADGPTAAQAYAVTGGNPLLLQALLEDRGAGLPPPGTAETAAGAAAVGSGYLRALLSCMRRCEPAALPVARALAVLGEDSAPAALAPLARTDAETVTAALDAMNSAGLLDRGRFRHPAARSAVLDDLSAEQRRDLHLAAAVLKREQGAPPTDVAPHLLMADLTMTDHSRNAWVVPLLQEAAAHELRGERVEPAVRYLELAHQGCTSTRERAAIGVRLVSAESRVNPAAAARRLPALAAAMRAGHLGDQDVTALIEVLLHHGLVAEAAEALAQVRASDAAGRPARTAAGLRATELWLACSHPALARGGQPLTDSAHGQGTQLDFTMGPLLKSATALAHALAQGATEHAVAEAQHVLQAARLSDSTTWATNSALVALYALIYADRLDVAQPWCDRLVDESATCGTGVAQAKFTAARAEIALRRGELPAAYDLAHRSFTGMPPAGWGVLVGLPLSCLVSAATRMGRYADAAEHLAHAVPEDLLKSRYGLHYLHARGEHYLATDRHYAALADFFSCRELMTGWGLDSPDLVPWRTSAAEAWLRHGGNRVEARRLVNEQLAKLGPGSSRTRGVALRLLAATGKAAGRPQLLTEAVSILEEHGDQYELARTLADLSRAHQRLRDHRRAWTVARRAWHVAKMCGADALCEELRPSRTRPEGPPEAASEAGPAADPLACLTAAERRVAALAAAGYTNREIAGKLYITPSTIEQHLTRVYRKLNVKYRKDLPADLNAKLPDTA